MGFLSGALGSIFGSSGQSEKIEDRNNAGVDFLKSNKGMKMAQGYGQDAQGLMAGLMGLGGDSDAAQKAFETYQGSTGYQFRLGEGMDAITGQRAARGILNSGATSKELMNYGQNLASAEFGNYFDMLTGTADRGLNSAFQVGNAATQAGMANAQVEAGRQETQSSAFGGLIKTGLSLFGF